MSLPVQHSTEHSVNEMKTGTCRTVTIRHYHYTYDITRSGNHLIPPGLPEICVIKFSRKNI